MKSLSAAQVAEPIYAFVQMAFTGKSAPRNTPLTRQDSDNILQRVATLRPIQIKEAMALPAGEKKALNELLVQYVMFLTMFSNLEFAPDFLSGTDETCIGASVLAYMEQRQWPFPQQLPWLAAS